ncbi:axin [Lepeophtheirus salmonis]|uniref:Uncharacterized protein n=1 Tax=Lepeophtheirus salmonis TaxID=72036 RepID=A0A0K2UUI2_LEPSM|nr:axin-like [Lepeophtheirus salmonis]
MSSECRRDAVEGMEERVRGEVEVARSVNCLGWAENLDNVLGDGEGVRLYQRYLEEESLSHLLKFWFACEGLKKEKDERVIEKYIRVITKNFISSSLLNLSEKVEGDILRELRSKPCPAPTIFDKAQNQVKELMLQTAYPNFLKSDIYLNYLQAAQNSEQDSKTSSIVFQEPGLVSESEYHSKDVSSKSSSKLVNSNSSFLPTLHEYTVLNLSGPQDIHSVPLTRDALYSTQRRRRDHEASFPFDAFGSAYNPVSRQDSELQSCSSGAYTTTDDNYSSFTDNSVLDKKKSKHKLKFDRQKIKDNLNYNYLKEDKTIPRPVRAGQVPPDPLSPKEFAGILTERLQNYLDQKHYEKKTFEILSNKLDSVEGFESDQSILDEHVSRIWKDKTPIHIRSPGESFGPPRSPNRTKWNCSKTLPGTIKNVSLQNPSISNGLLDPSFFSSSYSCELEKKQLQHSMSSSNGHERVKEWVSNVSSSSRITDEDQCRFRNGPKFSSKSSKTYARQRVRQNDQNLTNSTTHQQLQEVNRRLLMSKHVMYSVTYTFSNEPNGMPYRVKIPCSTAISQITLYQVKNNLPKLGQYRFYFKTKVDGEPCFEEERDDTAYVPIWSEGKIIVECREDLA